MIGWINDKLRPPLDALACRAATPFSVLLHCIGYVSWWSIDPESSALVISLSLEAIVLGLVIIDKQVRETAEDREARAKVDKELLEAVPGARPEVAT